MSEVTSVETPNAPDGGESEQIQGGKFNWTIGDVLGEALDKLKGFKLSLWGAALIYLLIAVPLNVVLDKSLTSENLAAEAVGQLIIVFVTYPLAAGLAMMGIKRAAGIPVRAAMVLNYYDKILPIFLLYLVSTIMVGIGFLLLILPGIYLAIAYSLALPLMVEKNLGIWEALETSRKAITKCWFRFFGLMLLMTIILVISVIPLGLGLIWTIPLFVLVIGIVYRDLFGANESETAPQSD